MTASFFDTSALVKLVMDEPGAKAAREAWRSAETRRCSRIAFVEVRAALAAVHRRRRFDAGEYRAARETLLDLLAEAEIIEVDEPLVDLAGDLAERHALRGYGAVHLAAALTAGAEVFVSSDAEQLRAAGEASLATLDPATVP